MSGTETLDAVRREIVVEAGAERAWAVFTERFGAWWPRSHAIGEHPMVDAVIEPREGGRWYERSEDGTETEWGKVLTWAPRARLVLAWHIDASGAYEPDPARASHVEIRFVPETEGRTRVELEHRGFERHVSGGADVRAGVSADDGWYPVLARFQAAAEEAAI